MSNNSAFTLNQRINQMKNLRKLTYDGIKPIMSQFHDNSREIYKPHQKKHEFDFLQKYEKPINFQFRQDRRSSIRTSVHQTNLNFRLQPRTCSIKLPSFHNRKNVSKSIHEIFSTNDPSMNQSAFKIH
ncbi:unnamed protein product [Paramecium primaurelia]|uniref:Uncharacterized protein n=1 Tax=Paramecium primaurelia TaxID=5886 RepID=A0A8S1JVW4_PARPR|nr:unnamed protein product [Paramecium primaurelia]